MGVEAAKELAHGMAHFGEFAAKESAAGFKAATAGMVEASKVATAGIVKASMSMTDVSRDALTAVVVICITAVVCTMVYRAGGLGGRRWRAWPAILRAFRLA